jgi:ABC-type lipoprotein release transport system permease subunit
MRIPILYNVRSMLRRPVSTALTALGVGLVVAVFIGMLALANGFQAALVRTGSDDNVMVLRRSADSEINSGIERPAASLISASPHVAKGADGRAMVSPEAYMIVPLPRLASDTNALANVVVRGISDAAWEVRTNIRLLAGQRPESGRAEVCIGRKLAGRMPNTNLGETIRFGGRGWTVACHFEAGGSAFESEIWAENEQVLPVFKRDVFNSVTFRMADPRGFDEVKRALEDNRQITVDVHRESEFYASQSQLLGTILRILAILITSIMAVGAIFGAVNTMYAAVSARTPEIAVLLTLGFPPRSVLASFLAESAIIAFAGGLIGCLLALPINGIVTSTTNWASFSEIAFSFMVTPGLMLAGLMFAVIMGVLGGFFPARRAAKLPVIQALR